MSETLSKTLTGREIRRFDAARLAFREPVTGPEWLRDTQPEISAIEITEGGTIYRYTRLDDPGYGGLIETVISGGEAR